MAKPLPAGRRECYLGVMAIAALQTILDRIDSWPEERQEAAAELLASLEATTGAEDDLQVSDEDLAEIDRRLADPGIRRVELAEFNARVDRLLRR
ncbi:hypothetical protein [Enterovirga sp. CN4-39]|uniref:hypothetical protein n=1 Tax=Enterovirga sp. CN4-39 TaxID=3400910 RepID=UPI003BFF720C